MCAVVSSEVSNVCLVRLFGFLLSLHRLIFLVELFSPSVLLNELHLSKCCLRFHEHRSRPRFIRYGYYDGDSISDTALLTDEIQITGLVFCRM